MSTYDPRVPSKTAIIKKNLHLLHANIVNKEIFPPKNHHLGWQKKKKSRTSLQAYCSTKIRSAWAQEQTGFFPCKERCDTCRHSKETAVLVSPWDGRHWTIKQHITCSSPNTVYVIMCEVHNEWYVGSTTDLKAHWRNHKSDTKLKKVTKCGVADHVKKFKHPEDPQLGFLTIMAVEAVKEKKDLIVWENYWMCNLGTIFKGMNTRKDFNIVLKDRSSRH